MTIYTRFGTEVEIINAPGGESALTVDVLTEFGTEREVDWRALKADGGILEIVAALKAADSSREAK